MATEMLGDAKYEKKVTWNIHIKGLHSTACYRTPTLKSSIF